MGKLDGKVAVVTGATSGMGRGIANRFAREGAAVVVSGRDEDRGNDVINEITGAGGKASFAAGDITTSETNQNLVERAVQTYGGLDILVCSAGELGIASLTEISEELWEKTVATNLTAVFYLLKYGIPAMLERGGGTVVVIGSIAGYKVFPNHPAYCSSKGALLQLVRQVALDYGPAIRINALHPGQVDTPLLWDSAKAFPNPSEVVQNIAAALPLRRLGVPEDIAGAALFLASEDSSWITGSNIVIDGGSLCLS
jgi:NAD(P)-dependent dehydrogenase (short-subunit alcohol dehydrogenase family)